MLGLKYIKHDDIDFEKWDQAVLNSQIPFVSAQSFYLNATCPNWDALIIGNYESVFPITAKSKFGFKYLPQPPFTSQLGAYGKVTEEIVQLFYNYILDKYTLIDLEFNASNLLTSEYISPKNTYVIKYFDGYKFNQNTKRNIAKAVQNEFVVEQIENKDVVNISKKYLNPFLENEVKLPKSTVELMNQLLINSSNANQLFSFKVVDKLGNLKAIGHFICNGKHAFYLKGTNFDKAENSGSMHLLMQHAIDFFAQKAPIFDFGGGQKPGLANFYAGFGGQVMSYSFLQVNKIPWIIKIVKNKK